MARLEQCFNCVKNNTIQCPKQARLDGSYCAEFEENDGSIKPGMHEVADEINHTSINKFHRFNKILAAALSVFLISLSIYHKLDLTHIQSHHDGSTKQNSTHFTVGNAPTISRRQALSEGCIVDGNIAWTLPQGYVLSNDEYIKTGHFGQSHLRVIPFKSSKYNYDDFFEHWNGWEDRKKLATQCQPTNHGSCNYTLLQGGQCFQWTAESFNLPNNKLPDDDIILMLAAVYLPTAHRGCYIYFHGHKDAEDDWYDIFHSIYAIK